MNKDIMYNEKSFYLTQQMTKVYGWMFIGLMLTALISVLTVQTSLINFASNPVSLIILVVLELALVFFLSSRVMKISYPTATILFLTYSVLNGIVLSTIFLVYSSSMIAYAFVSTAAIFGVMSLYGLITKKDLTGLGSFLIMSLFGLIIASLVNIIFRSQGFSIFLSYIGVFIFVLLTAYDTQKIKVISESMEGTGKEGNIAIIGALTLYLDFVNIFLYLLRIFARRD